MSRRNVVDRCTVELVPPSLAAEMLSALLVWPALHGADLRSRYAAWRLPFHSVTSVLLRKYVKLGVSISKARDSENSQLSIRITLVLNFVPSTKGTQLLPLGAYLPALNIRPSTSELPSDNELLTISYLSRVSYSLSLRTRTRGITMREAQQLIPPRKYYVPLKFGWLCNI